MEYEAIFVCEPRLPERIDIEEEPILGAMLQHDSHNVIVCIDKKAKKLNLAPRITISIEKPFIEFDWHLASFFCRRCQTFREISVVQRWGICPFCGVLSDGQICLNQGTAVLEFNQLAHAHPCDCEACAHYREGEFCKDCKLVPRDLTISR